MTEVLSGQISRPAAQRKVGLRARIFDAAAGAVAGLYLFLIGLPRITAHFSGDVPYSHYAQLGFFILLSSAVLFELKTSLFRKPRMLRSIYFTGFAFAAVFAIGGLFVYEAQEGTGQPVIFYPGMAFSFGIGCIILVVGGMEIIPKSKILDDLAVVVGALIIVVFAVSAMPVPYFWGAGVHLWVPFLIFIAPTTGLIALEWLKEHPDWRRFFYIGRGGAARFGGVYSFFKYDFDRVMGLAGRKKVSGLDGDDPSHYVSNGKAPIYAGRTIWEDDPKVGNRHIGIDSDTHMLTIARTGGGKSYYAAWNTLLMWSGGAFILDPKGEHYERTGLGHAVFDPWHEVTEEDNPEEDRRRAEEYGLPPRYKLKSVTINPLSIIDPKDKRAKTDAMSIVSASLIQMPKESANSKHFRESTETLMLGVIAHVLTTYDAEYHNLPSIYDTLLTGSPFGGATDPDAFEDLTNAMATNEAMGRAPMDAAKILKEAGENERGSFITTCVANLKWVNDPAIRPMLQGDGFDLKTLKRDMKRLYFVIPFDAMKNHSRLMRTIISMALLSCREHSTHGRRCLFLLDEFYSLGKFTPISADLVTLRSREITLWLMVQNFGQLKELYDDPQTFMSACNKQFFAVEDEETAEMISTRLGEYREQWETQDGGRGKARRHEEKGRPLRRKEEVLEEIKQDSGVQYFLPVNGHPMRLSLVPFTYNYDKNQYREVSKSRQG